MRADLHVLHVRSSAGLYGAEHVILGLVPALAAHGVSSTLLSIDNPYLDRQPLAERARSLGIETRNVPCRGRFDFATIDALRRAMAEHPGAIVHVHDYKSALYAWLARGRRAVPIVATSHGQFASSASLRLYHRLELSLMRRFERVCIVSDSMRPLLARAGVDASRVRLIENGIDTARFHPGVAPLPRADYGVAADAIVFGSAMRLTEQKDPLALIDAFGEVARTLRCATLVIAGEGPLRDAVSVRAAELGISARVRLIGACAEPERFHALLDVFVLPSRYEGLPLALLEAMATERAIVATAVGDVPSVLLGTGVEPVAPGSRNALAAAMLHAAEAPRTGALRRRVVERYSLPAMAAAYAGVYLETRSPRERVAAAA